MPTAMADFRSAELTDADLYRDPAAEALCATRDNTWTPPITFRGGLYPVRSVWYLTQIESGPKLRRPLKVEVSPTQDGAFEVHSAILGISGVGESLAAATRDLCSTFVAFWEEFSQTPSDHLASESSAILMRMRSVIG
jgi:hypothetical protein